MLFGRLIKLKVDNGRESYYFSDYRINFTASKKGRNASSCRVSIYNLSENTRNYIFNGNQKIYLSAGYLEESGEEIVYIGDIKSTENRMQRPDIITIIDSGDGAVALCDAQISLSYNPGSDGKQMLREIVDSFKLPKKTNLSLIQNIKKIFSNGFNYTGSSQVVLDKICKNMGLTWSIQNDELKVYEDYNTDKSVWIELSSDTGMLGSPNKIKIKQGDKDVDGWIIETLLQPKAEPGGVIVVSSAITGNDKLFKIVSVEHTGDNFEGDFKTIIEAVTL